MVGKKTLMVYASKGHVTEENAHVIADILRDKYRLDVDLVDIRKNPSPDLTQHRNVIVGSGVRMGKVYKEALRFLEKNDFEKKKVAIFLSSGRAGNPKSYDDAITKYIKGTLEKHPHVKPVATEAFGGRIRILGFTIADNRDIDKVKAWAEELGKKLKD